MTSNKTVFIVGVLDKKGSTNISMARSFIKLGFDVVPINYRTIILEHGMLFFNNFLMDSLKQYKPVLTLFCKCNGIPSQIIKECNKYTTTWLWNPDMINEQEAWNRCPEVIEHAKVANYSSCTGAGIAEHFKKQGADNCHHIFCGLDYDIFYPVEADVTFDMSFIGSRTNLRDSILKPLGEKYFVGLGGTNYTDEELINEDFKRVCSESKIMLSINSDGGEEVPGYVSNRIFRYLGCGACVAHYDPHKYLEPYFGDSILYFSDVDDLCNQLDTATEEFIGRTAVKGRDLALKKYTWDHTVYHILNKVENDTIH